MTRHQLASGEQCIESGWCSCPYNQKSTVFLQNQFCRFLSITFLTLLQPRSQLSRLCCFESFKKNHCGTSNLNLNFLCIFSEMSETRGCLFFRDSCRSSRGCVESVTEKKEDISNKMVLSFGIYVFEPFVLL